MQHCIGRIRFQNFEYIFFIAIINTNPIKQKSISDILQYIHNSRIW